MTLFVRFSEKPDVATDKKELALNRSKNYRLINEIATIIEYIKIQFYN